MKAHVHSWHAKRFEPHTWRSDIREYPSCSYCGSMDPETLAKHVQAGAKIELADMKYGWPHKLYLNDIVAGHAKFYTEHLQDATPEQRKTIERALGLAFEFSEDGRVIWAAYKELE